MTVVGSSLWLCRKMEDRIKTGSCQRKKGGKKQNKQGTWWIILKDAPLSRITSRSSLRFLSLPPGAVTCPGKRGEQVKKITHSIIWQNSQEPTTNTTKMQYYHHITTSGIQSWRHKRNPFSKQDINNIITLQIKNLLLQLYMRQQNKREASNRISDFYAKVRLAILALRTYQSQVFLTATLLPYGAFYKLMLWI